MAFIRALMLLFAVSTFCADAFLVSHRPYHAVVARSYQTQRAPVSATSQNQDPGSFVDRRRWLQAAGAAVVTAVPVKAASASPSFVSSVQGSVQDAIAPGHWLGQFFGLNSRTETWDFPRSTPADVSAALVEVLNGLTPERRAKLLIPELQVARADAERVHVLTWTKAEWLDALDVSFQAPGGKNKGGTVATASFYATGFFPTSLPLAPLLNVGMAWFPFASPGPRGEALQEFRLRVIKGLLVKNLEAREGRLLG